MAKSKKKTEEKDFDETGAVIRESPITRTLEENYMPYSMSVIIARAIPEIDGFKPSHRKLLYTMYKMGLLTGARTKSANVVGATMHYNPHGDMAIYETLVRLTRGNEALLHPFIDSKGIFGKQYSKMAFAASRYTEVKLDGICREIFGGIDKDAVDMVDNYDATAKEPVLLPTAFPNILVSPNMGIAVGIASNICSFNLAEICDTAIAMIKGDDFDIFETLKGPDFSTGGQLLYNRESLEQIYSTGRGSVRVRSTYRYEKDGNCIEILSVPYTTNTSAILDKISDLVKSGRIRDINDVRDETDKDGLKLTIDLKRGADPDKLMKRLYKLTPLEDDFSCNFNVLVGGAPQLLGVRAILEEWHAFRRECLKREYYYTLSQKNDKLHLLKGLAEILLDIDKAIRIIRGTENERDVIPNLCDGFGIDEPQAEFVAEIKLRNLNREYILNKTAEIESLEAEIAEIESILKSSKKLDGIIIKQLTEIKKKYGIPRHTEIVYDAGDQEDVSAPEEAFSAFVTVTAEGYFKRISLASIKASDTQKLKEGDRIVFSGEVDSKSELLFFTDRAQVYKSRLSEFDSIKASMLGDYIPTKLGFDEGERFLYFTYQSEFDGTLFVAFANGKAVNLPMSNYSTKTNRRRLTNAYSDTSPAVGMTAVPKGGESNVFIKTRLGRAVLIKNTLVPLKSTRTSGGVQVIALKKNDAVESFGVVSKDDGRFSRYRKTRIPTPGIVYTEIDAELNQTELEV